MKPMLAMDATATEHILHSQGIGNLKHLDVAWYRTRSDPITVIAKHCLTLGYVNMDEENV